MTSLRTPPRSLPCLELVEEVPEEVPQQAWPPVWKQIVLEMEAPRELPPPRRPDFVLGVFRLGFFKLLLLDSGAASLDKLSSHSSSPIVALVPNVPLLRILYFH